MLGDALALSHQKTLSSQTSTIQKLTENCENLDKETITETKAETNTETVTNKESCAKRLRELEKKLKLELANQYKKQLRQQEKQSAEKLKSSQLALQKLKQKLATIENNKSAPQASNPQLATDQMLSKDKGDSDVAEKLFYYEKILNVNGVKDALFINYFAIEALQEKQHYRFQLILGRLGKPANTMGKFEIFLAGNKIIEAKETEKLADGTIREETVAKKEPVTYKHIDLLPPEAVSGQNNFAFKYYQIIENEFVLPENFELESLSVKIYPEGLPSVTKQYQWSSLKQQAFKEFK